ncbi:MAG: ThuA domain-containing protein [Rikenellaceae bacterium]
MKKILLLILTFAISISASLAAKPIKAMIITGQNNHYWKVSSKAISNLLTEDGYEVEIATSPKAGEDMSNFCPDFKGYKLVVVDYFGDSWCDKLKTEFIKYVKSGKGVVIYHAANNAFSDWDEYESVIALGGWGDRGKESKGYYTEWKNGKLEKYEASDRVGHHGARHDYTLKCRNLSHPAVDKTLKAGILQPSDELYDSMKGKANIKDVLYTAYSDPKKGGTGKEEVLIFTVDFGRAKIFHTMIGHAMATIEQSPALNSETFKKTFLAGAAWASGKNRGNF